MRFISSIATIALFALSANAASMKKRGISAQVQACRNHIDAIDAQISVVHTTLSGYEAALGYNGALAIFNQEQVLKNHLANAAIDCCAVTGIITDEEADAMLVTVTPVIPKATNALATLVVKKPVFDSVYLTTPLVKTETKNLYTNTTVVYTCIHNIGSVQHPTYIPVINDYIRQLDTAFINAYNAYGMALPN